MTKTTADFIEPTEVQLRERVYTHEQISMSDIWLAAFLGSPVAQRVVECPNIQRALLELWPKDIGEFLKIYDSEDKSVAKRVALILAKALLPKWQARFPDDPLGQDAVNSIAYVIHYGRDEARYKQVTDKICYGKYGQFAASSALGTLLGVANGRNELYLDDISHALQMDVQMLVALIGRNLIPYLLDRVEIQIN